MKHPTKRDETQTVTMTDDQGAISRRELLRSAALGGAGVAGAALAASTPGLAAASGVHSLVAVPSAAFTGTINMVPWAFYPSKSMVVTTANPNPANTIDILSQQWLKTHPGVSFHWVKQWSADADYQTWLNTQVTGGTEPDVVFWWPPSDPFVQDAKEVNLDPYLDKPNPYVPGNKHWRDIFPNALLNKRWASSVDGHFYGVPVDYFETALFINADAFKKAGLNPDNPWATWEDFMHAHDVLQKAGFRTPFSSAALWSWWPRGIIGDMIMPRSLFKTLDIKGRGIDLGLDSEESTRAFYKGLYTPTADYFVEYLHIMKRWSQYWPKSWAVPATNPDDMFLRKQSAIHWTSAWGYTSIQQNKLRTFDFRMVYFPSITKATAATAIPDAKPRSVGSPGDVYFISENAVKKGAVDACVDWLMFLTAPKNDGYLVGGQKTETKLIPAVKGAPADPAVAKMSEIVSRGSVQMVIPWVDVDVAASGNCDRIFQNYIIGATNEKDTLTQFAKQFTLGAAAAIKKNKEAKVGTKWDISKW